MPYITIPAWGHSSDQVRASPGSHGLGILHVQYRQQLPGGASHPAGPGRQVLCEHDSAYSERPPAPHHTLPSQTQWLLPTSRTAGTTTQCLAGWGCFNVTDIYDDNLPTIFIFTKNSIYRIVRVGVWSQIPLYPVRLREPGEWCTQGPNSAEGCTFR